jgi:hypothetical protein
MQNLQSTNPMTFGNTGTFQTKFTSSYDPVLLSSAKKASNTEKIAMSSWNNTMGSPAKKKAVHAGRR